MKATGWKAPRMFLSAHVATLQINSLHRLSTRRSRQNSWKRGRVILLRRQIARALSIRLEGYGRHSPTSGWPNNRFPCVRLLTLHAPQYLSNGRFPSFVSIRVRRRHHSSKTPKTHYDLSPFDVAYNNRYIFSTNHIDNFITRHHTLCFAPLAFFTHLVVTGLMVTRGLLVFSRICILDEHPKEKARSTSWCPTNTHTYRG